MSDARPPQPDIRQQNVAIIADYRARGGQSEPGTMPLVLLTTTGARSGRPHTIPVAVREDGPDLVVAGSRGGLPEHPQWYRNLLANPELTVEYLGTTYQAQATTVTNGPDRDRLFAMMAEVIPGLYRYQDRCRNQRQIPIMRITRLG
jgi:deazaflavin-dependent oxidoreductase (nitroreductase family)